MYKLNKRNKKTQNVVGNIMKIILFIAYIVKIVNYTFCTHIFVTFGKILIAIQPEKPLNNLI